jgi:hypothetical protein
MTRAMPNLKDVLSTDIWDNGPNPSVPTTHGNQGGNKIIRPGEGMIKVVKEKSHYAMQHEDSYSTNKTYLLRQCQIRLEVVKIEVWTW